MSIKTSACNIVLLLYIHLDEVSSLCDQSACITTISFDLIPRGFFNSLIFYDVMVILWYVHLCFISSKNISQQDYVVLSHWEQL